MDPIIENSRPKDAVHTILQFKIKTHYVSLNSSPMLTIDAQELFPFLHHGHPTYYKAC